MKQGMLSGLPILDFVSSSKFEYKDLCSWRMRAALDL